MRSPRASGHSLIELMTVVVIVMTMMAISIPIAQNTYRGFHLTAASTAIAGAIQGARYQAIQNGCPSTITFSTTATKYQVASELVSGATPTCAASYSNVGQALPWSTSGDVSLIGGTSAMTLTLNANGIVTSTGGAPSCASGVGCLVLTNGKYTNTISISGVGNVTVTSP